MVFNLLSSRRSCSFSFFSSIFFRFLVCFFFKLIYLKTQSPTSPEWPQSFSLSRIPFVVVVVVAHLVSLYSTLFYSTDFSYFKLVQTVPVAFTFTFDSFPFVSCESSRLLNCTLRYHLGYHPSVRPRSPSPASCRSLVSLPLCFALLCFTRGESIGTDDRCVRNAVSVAISGGGSSSSSR